MNTLSSQMTKYFNGDRLPKLLIGVIFICLAIACENPIKFEEPQPFNKKNLRQIPLKLQGTYVSASDSSFLTITDNQIISWADVVVSSLLDSLNLTIDPDKVDTIATDSIRLIDGRFNLSLKIISEDSAKLYYSFRDTIFQISESNLLRTSKGHYFLNKKRRELEWSVQSLTFDSNVLTFSKLKGPEDIAVLKEITNVEEITLDSGNVITYKLNPTRKEFRQLTKYCFSPSHNYIKLK